jgi:lysozyme family protein
MRPSVAIAFVATELEGEELTFDPEPTRFGITQSVYDAFRHLRGLPPRSVAQITQDEYVVIYSGNYWGVIHASQLPDGLDLVLFQLAVNVGTGRAAKILQRVLGVTEDGAIGPATLAAVASFSPSDLIDEVLNAQDAYYDDLVRSNPGRNADYADGWHNRVTKTRLFLATGLTESGAAAGGGIFLGILALLALAWFALRSSN